MQQLLEKNESGVARVFAQNYDERLCKVFLLSSTVHCTHLHTWRKRSTDFAYVLVHNF
jgi:hypothetical protein